MPRRSDLLQHQKPNSVPSCPSFVRVIRSNRAVRLADVRLSRSSPVWIALGLSFYELKRLHGYDTAWTLRPRWSDPLALRKGYCRFSICDFQDNAR